VSAKQRLDPRARRLVVSARLLKIEPARFRFYDPTRVIKNTGFVKVRFHQRVRRQDLLNR